MGDVYMVNGKILSGLPNHAKDIEFDNTGTTLNSTNAEDAIKEVNSNLSSYPDFLGEGAGGASGSITLNAPITNYRLLLFVYKAGNGTIEITTECIPSNIASSFSSAIRVGYYNGNSFSEFDCTYTSDTTFTFTEMSTSSSHSICIYGVK